MRWSLVRGMEIWHWMEMIKNIILLVGEAETGLLLFSLQASVLKPTCQGEKKMNRFLQAYGISTGASIKQLAAAALGTYRKQLILIASCHGTSNLDPCQQRRGGSFTISHMSFFFSILLLWHMKTSSSVSLAVSTASSLCSETERSLPLNVRPPDVTSEVPTADVRRSNIFVNNISFQCLQLLASWK